MHVPIKHGIAATANTSHLLLLTLTHEVDSSNHVLQQQCQAGDSRGGSRGAYITLGGAGAPKHRDILFNARVLHLHAEQPDSTIVTTQHTRTATHAAACAPVPLSHTRRASNMRPCNSAALRCLAPAGRRFEPPETLQTHADEPAGETSHVMRATQAEERTRSCRMHNITLLPCLFRQSRERVRLGLHINSLNSSTARRSEAA